jgi:hypothetical protein
MKLTREIIHSAGTRGEGFNRAQLALLKVPWPPQKGWLANLVGQEVSDEDWQLILRLSGTDRKTRRELLEGNTAPGLFAERKPRKQKPNGTPLLL